MKKPPEQYLEQPEIRAWAKLIRTSQSLLDSIDRELKDEGLPPLVWYDVLLELRNEGRSGLRPFVLKNRLLLAQYNLSRLLDRMDDEGMIERAVCKEDKRGRVVRITAAGKQLMKKMWPVYGKGIYRNFARHLDISEIDSLTQILRKIAVK